MISSNLRSPVKADISFSTSWNDNTFVCDMYIGKKDDFSDGMSLSKIRGSLSENDMSVAKM